ncbi:MAG: DUF2157 domain-containing protein [Micavibrio aeruginosavorus]|uniref:DUF2157 domain-containing protein n=1 Tax=Micavibrio aeruginosavorus TaxID=349221 RepID=A0A2W5PRL3_9BACT|nr:MAG: DUF2157 domain-containing protein [Micavibrio aeruginosavorus]
MDRQVMNTGREQALEQIASLASQYDLSIDDIAVSLNKRDSEVKSGTMLSRVLGYIGGAFIFGGLALFIGMQWETLGSAERVIVTYGCGFVAFVLGLITLNDKRYENASTPLFLSSSALLPTGMFVFLQEYVQGDDTQLAALVVFSLLTFQFMAAFYKFRRTSLLFCGYLFFNTAATILMDRADAPVDVINVAMSASILMVASALDKGPHRAIVPLWYFIGGMFLLLSAYEILQDTPYDLGLFVLSIAMIFFSVHVKSRTLLLVNTLGLFSFLGYYTSKYFADVVGWPIAIIVMGFLMVGTSAAAIKLDRRIKDKESSRVS